jgi:hypothetical protein
LKFEAVIYLAVKIFQCIVRSSDKAVTLVR